MKIKKVQFIQTIFLRGESPLQKKMFKHFKIILILKIKNKIKQIQLKLFKKYLV